MRTHRILTVCALLSISLVTACGDDDDGGGTDSGVRDAATMDATTPGDDGGADAGGTDGGTAVARGRENPPTPGAQIDRVGRPAISTALVSTFTPDEMRATRRGVYSANGDPSTWATMFTAEIATSLGILDALDATCGNQLAAGPTATAGRYNTLAGVIANDRLWVNAASGNNTGNLYLGHEAQTLGVIADGGAGGRRPTDDVIERSYSALAAGMLAGVDDTITSDEGGASNTTFPFLGAPE